LYALGQGVPLLANLLQKSVWVLGLFGLQFHLPMRRGAQMRYAT
jgi:hypothetical protein